MIKNGFVITQAGCGENMEIAQNTGARSPGIAARPAIQL
jgi:hypothetical protein